MLRTPYSLPVLSLHGAEQLPTQLIYFTWRSHLVFEHDPDNMCRRSTPLDVMKSNLLNFPRTDPEHKFQGRKHPTSARLEHRWDTEFPDAESGHRAYRQALLGNLPMAKVQHTWDI